MGRSDSAGQIALEIIVLIAIVLFASISISAGYSQLLRYYGEILK